MSHDILAVPSQLFAHLEAQPPLMRASAGNAYVGKEVNWNLMFVDGSERVTGKASLIFDTGVLGDRMIRGDVSLTEHPYLRSLPSGEPVRVRGTIRRVDALFVELEVAEMTLVRTVGAASQ